jgi:DNA topoisomerase VI subunit A
MTSRQLSQHESAVNQRLLFEHPQDARQLHQQQDYHYYHDEEEVIAEAFDEGPVLGSPPVAVVPDPATAISEDEDASSVAEEASSETVIERIEELMIRAVMDPLDEEECEPPRIGHKTFFHATHCRHLTSIVLVASFCHDLLQSHRTTTTREVYYYYVTHFRNQAECNKAIWDLAGVLNVPRSSLGLYASPKGWCCGCLELYNQDGDLIWNGRALDVHGMAITMHSQKASIRSDAKCIIVIEKEGVYNRLSEDKFFLDYYPCILVTGKGFPDVATRQWVQHLQRELQLPVCGLCDGNPYGISVLNTYQYDQVVTKYRNNHPRKKRLDMMWMGLRPSQLEVLDFPPSVFQQQTEMDKKRLQSLLSETHPFHQQGNSGRRMEELLLMEEHGYKVELEALNWKGMDFLCQWVHSILVQHERALATGIQDSSHII